MRLFLATTFPPEILRELNEQVARFRLRLPSANWVRQESQHLTFAFLGDQPEETVERLAAVLEPALGGIASFTASLRGCGVFPNARHPRVGWVGLDPEEPFVSVARTVREAVTKSGVTFEESEFKPHLTLMRIRDPWPPASIDLFQRSLRSYVSGEALIEEVTLFSSVLDPKGAIHTPLRKFALGPRP